MSDALGLVGTTVLEKYAIESVVGEGGFAVVYRATHLLWKRPVAIKVFSVLDSVPEDMRGKLLEDFLQEGALLAQLSEQTTAIVQARDVGMLTTKSGMTVPYMVLEWLEGETLEDKLIRERTNGGKLRSMAESVALLTPVADALAVAHARGIVHRDVKPANIFLVGPVGGGTDGTAIKLLDFGIAKVVQDAQKMAGSFNKTSGVVTSFTPAYGAPEQFSRTYGATGPWTDVFALALILGEMTSGRAPIDGDDVGQLAFASMNEKVRPSPRTLGATVSDPVESVLLRALSVKVGERQQNAREFWSQLTGVLAVPDRVSGRSLSPQEPQDVASASTILAPGDLRSELVRTDVDPPAPADRSAATVPQPKAPPVALFVVGGLVGVGILGIAGFTALHGFGKLKTTSVTDIPTVISANVDAGASANPTALITKEDSGACPIGMVPIPGGRFFQGNDDGDKDEKPAHNVTLSPYCIDRFEVTVAEYMQCSNSGGCKKATPRNEWEGITAKDRAVYDPLCNVGDPAAHANYPINCVDWEMAETFCEASKKTLPTEAQWEFAARGPDGRKYPWGDEEPTGGHLNACGPECIAWVKANGIDFPTEAMYAKDDGFPNTAPVGSFPAGKSRYGVEDVVGNVFEWTNDWFAPYKMGKIGTSELDPHGPADGKHRVMRGGAWNTPNPAWLRPSFRYKDLPTKRSHGVGFRCAKML